MTSTLDDMPERALAWHRAGRRAALATVIETWGSAPRRVGAQMCIAEDGEMAGSVSGGCVEGAVVLEAQEALRQGAAVVLEYGVSDDDAFAVGLACGGRIRILVDPIGSALPETVLHDLVAARAARRPVVYVAELDGPGRCLAPPEPYAEAVRRDRSQVSEDGRQFVQIYNPPLRAVIVGAVHIAQALVPMAQLAGYDVTVVDPRGAFASAERFPGVTLSPDWPDEALRALGLDARTAVVTLTHDPKLDDPAIRVALASDVFYLGCLGSKRTHAKRVQRLTEAGVTEADLGRIHAPVGLDIGAASPAEIAVSVLAQMTQSLRQGAAGPLPL